MIEYLTLFLLVIGALFMVIAAIGILRMPDIFMRMSATTKAATLGVGLILLGAALYFGDIAITGRAIAIIVFLLLTAPVAAHILGRAAYFDNVPLWKGTIADELRGTRNSQVRKHGPGNAGRKSAHRKKAGEQNIQKGTRRAR